MGFNLGKSISHAFKKTNKSIGHAFKDTGHFVSKNVGNVYKDVKGAVAYTGKHLINDVDNVSNTLSSPILLIGVAVLAGIILLK